MSYLGKKGEESLEMRFLSSSNDIDPLWRSVGHLGKVEVSCSEVLSQFEMLSGLEKFSLDSGNGKNDENQEKNGIVENVFFSSRKHALQRLIEELRPKMPNVFFFNFCSSSLIPLHNCSDTILSNQNLISHPNFSFVWRIDRLTHSTAKGHKKINENRSN